jgi:hypothetical protein
MRDAKFRSGVRHARAAVVAVGLALVAMACGLDKAPNPDLIGPSDTGISVELSALPDVLNADGVSRSVIRLVLRDNDGNPFSNHSVLFQSDGDGRLVPSASSTFVGPIQTGLVMATDSNGMAAVVYVAGFGLRTVRIYTRPYGTDTTYTFDRSVEILQQ